MTLQKVECGHCNKKKHQKKPNKYCISCSFEIKHKVISLMESSYRSESGKQTAKRHWDKLPKYIRRDIVENNQEINKVNI